MIRLLATDVDHTLYDSHKKGVSKRNIDAIEKLQAKGVYVILASSRVLQGMKAINDLLQLKQPLQYMVVNNGAELYEVENYNKFLDFPFKMEDVILFEQIAKEYHVNYSICQDEYSLVTGLDKSLEYDFYDVGIDMYWVHDITTKVKKPVYHCAFTGEVNVIYDLEKKMKELYGSQYFFNIPVPGYLDISLSTVSKASGVMEIAKMLGIAKEEIACIGDGDNDVPMFTIAGISACVGNGSALAKASATYVVDTCANDGFAQFVEQYILEE